MTSLDPQPSAPEDGPATTGTSCGPDEPARLDVVHRLGLLDAPPEASFDRLTRMATRLTGAPISLAVLVDDDRQFFLSEVGLADPWSSARETPLSHSFCRHVVAGGAPLVIPDTRADERVQGSLAIDELGVGAYAGVPLVCAGETVGSLCLIDGERRDWDAHELEVLQDLADIAMRELALRLAATEHREELDRLAFTDGLTGLYNQRAFSDRLDEEVRRSRRYGRPLSLVVFDLDHFGAVNETHGHETGNRVLEEFAARLLDMRRGSDVVARVGGEEFAWMLPETGGRSSMAAAERARAIIAETPFAGVGRVTASVGICSLEDASDAQELYRQADLALYWAKAAGRNTAVRYSPELIALQPGEENAHRLEAATTLAAVRALAGAVDAKDPSTQRHSERVAQLVGELAGVAGWDPARIVLLHSAALVHDVGKIGVPDTVLLKPGKLTAAEYEQVKTHASLGAEIVADLLSREQVQWIRHHHERHDGGGYPDGISGAQISEGAGLLAVADAWDAMTVARPYGTPRPIEEAVEEMRRGIGAQFVPDAVGALLTLHDRGALNTQATARPPGL